MASADTKRLRIAVTGVTARVRLKSCKAVAMTELREQLQRELDRVGIGARAVVVPTPWSVGPVAAYLFPRDPVTFIDSGVNTPAGLEALQAALAAEGLTPDDVKQVIVTHAHTDHFGGAVFLQERSGCPVYVHRADAEISAPDSWKDTNRKLFVPLGFSLEMLEAFFDDEEDADLEWRFPDFTPMDDGDTFETGAVSLRVEHHPGHSPGHVWVIDDATRAIFVGDYMLANHPTNAGLELDASHPTGRMPLLERYNAGLRELMERPSPCLFPAHGPPIPGHRDLIERRLAKTDRRTRHVFDALDTSPATALEVAHRLYGARAENSWEIMADLVGRLDLLVAEGRASSALGEDGVWYFRSNPGGLDV